MQIRILELKTLEEIKAEMEKFGVHPDGKEIMSPKAIFYQLRIDNLPARIANIIKQQMLSVGADAAISAGAIYRSQRNTALVAFATLKQYRIAINRLKLQPWDIPQIAQRMEQTLNNYQKIYLIKWRRFKLELGKRTYIMGILNVTPDSFSNGGKYFDLKSAVEHALRMEEEGADIIDVGGESTRPGAKKVSLEEELRRVIPVIKKLKRKLSIPISIDSRKSKVVREALEHGASIVNDISGLNYDPAMAKVVADYKVPVIIMHIKGTPATMQKNPYYQDLITEISHYFHRSIAKAHKAGIADNLIILDPGIGFGKRLQHNIEILKRLREFRSLGYPILIGTSRKSFIGEILNLAVQDRLYPSLASFALAICNGADIIRVHDVAAAKQVAGLIDAIVRSCSTDKFLFTGNK